jgi:hypothetical protein
VRVGRVRACCGRVGGGGAFVVLVMLLCWWFCCAGDFVALVVLLWFHCAGDVVALVVMLLCWLDVSLWTLDQVPSLRRYARTMHEKKGSVRFPIAEVFTRGPRTWIHSGSWFPSCSWFFSEGMWPVGTNWGCGFENFKPFVYYVLLVCFPLQ